MRTSGHIVSSLIMLPLFPILGDKVIIPMIASVAIDSDHIYQLIKEKAFTYKKIKYLSDNIYKIYQADPENAFKDILYLFHTIEFNLLLIFLSIWYPPLLLVVLGFSFHIISDIIHHYLIGMPIKRWLSLYVFLKVNRKK